MSRCSVMASTIWSPQVKTGLSEVMGSWKIMDMRLPRVASTSLSERASTSVSRSRMLPVTMRPGRSMSRITERAVTDLPQPDSPTTPSV